MMGIDLLKELLYEGAGVSPRDTELDESPTAVHFLWAPQRVTDNETFQRWLNQLILGVNKSLLFLYCYRYFDIQFLVHRHLRPPYMLLRVVGWGSNRLTEG